MKRLLLALALIAAPACAGPLTDADAAFARQQPRVAWVELLNATQQDPHNGTAWMYRARVALRLGRGDDAMTALDGALSAGYPEARTLHFRAHALLLIGEPESALAALAWAPIPAPYRGYAARMRGRALAALGDFPAAARAFGEAMALQPRSTALWIDIARFRRMTGERAGALEASEQALRLTPNDVPALVLRGELVRDQLGLRSALVWFNRALAIDPLDIPAQLERAATLGELGHTRAMLADTRAVLSLDPENRQAFYLQAVLAARARDFRLAAALLDRAGDELPAALLLRGTIALETGRPRHAAAVLGDLLARQPGNIVARKLLATAQLRSGLIPGMTEVTHTSHPATAEVRALLAAGRVAEAERAARSTAAANRGAPEALMLLGDVLLQANKPAEAAFVYRDAANLHFSDGIATRMIFALERAGQPAEARRVAALFRNENARLPLPLRSG